MLKISHIVSKEMVAHPDGSLWMIGGFDNEAPQIDYYNIYHWDAQNGINPDVEYFKLGSPNVILQSGYGYTKPVMNRQDLSDALIAEGFVRS